MVGTLSGFKYWCSVLLVCTGCMLSTGCGATSVLQRGDAAKADVKGADPEPQLGGPLGLVALMRNECKEAFLSWRMPPSSQFSRFHIYRQVVGQAPVQVTAEPIDKASNFVDRLPEPLLSDLHKLRWHLAEVREGGASSRAASVRLPENPCQTYVDVRRNHTTHGRALGFGDVNGDGYTDFVTRYPSVTVDPYFRLWRPSKGTYKLSASSMSGETLWVYDMDESIEMGIWYAPYLIYDLDQDGTAELIVKGGNPRATRADMSDASGRIVSGEEWLKIISGKDGATLLGKAPWPDRDGFGVGRNQPYEQYNRYSRNLLAIAYLDGRHPHVVVVRGTYDKHKVAAYRYQAESGLERVWQWENENPKTESGERKPNARELKRWWGQGAHTIRVADIDGDAMDEVIIGALALDHDGRPLWSTDRGHVDHIHLGDLVPALPGLELYYGSEQGHESGGMGTIRASDARPVWQYKGKTRHVHKEGLCADLLAVPAGLECYSGESDRKSFWLWGSGGQPLSTKEMAGLAPKAVYWADTAQKSLLRVSSDKSGPYYAELIDVATGQVVDRLDWPTGTKQDDRQYFKLLAVADLLGDWREEIVVADRGRLIIYTSRLPSATGIPWLMTDHTYRMAAILGSMGYYQQPLLGYDLGPFFSGAPRADVKTENHNNSSSPQETVPRVP